MRKETHDGYLSRVGNLMKAIMGNVLDKRSGSYEDLVLVHKFQEPFGADLAQELADVVRQYGAGLMSMQTAVERSYLVPNADKEIERIKREQTKGLGAATPAAADERPDGCSTRNSSLTQERIKIWQKQAGAPKRFRIEPKQTVHREVHRSVGKEYGAERRK